MYIKLGGFNTVIFRFIIATFTALLEYQQSAYFTVSPMNT